MFMIFQLLDNKTLKIFENNTYKTISSDDNI